MGVVPCERLVRSHVAERMFTQLGAVSRAARELNEEATAQATFASLWQ